MKKVHVFNAGPCLLPQVAIDNAIEALKDFKGTGVSVLSISHRTKEWDETMDECRALWRELLNIPYGATDTYGALAGRLGSSARAVGSAVGRNPISIIIPCHRVLAADGSLAGYAGGLENKEKLLRLEGVWNPV